MKLGIFGSRSLTGKESYDFIEKEIKEFHAENKIDFILLPGDIKGATDSALKISKRLLIPVTLYFYDKQVSAGKWKMIKSIKERTSALIKEADFFLLFHDGKSKGTLWDLKQIEKAKKQYRFFVVEEVNEFDLTIDDDWVDIHWT